MLYSDYKNYPIKEVSPTLLWEYDLQNFDYHEMRKLVIHRVIERGWPNDFYAILNLYGLEGVKEAIKKIKSLNKKDMNFVSVVFDIPFDELRCYREKPFRENY